jgi:tol-pal system protein YbgF
MCFLRSDNHLFALLVIFVFVSGCANLQSDIGALDRKVSRQKREVQVVRQKQADLDTRLDALQVELQRVRGGVEESTHYSRKASDDMISLGEDFSTHIKWQEEELNLLREEIRTMKTLLGMKVSAQKDKPVSLPVKKLTPRATTIPPTSNLAKITGVPDPEELYNSAYSKLNKKDFQGARKEFREFLELFSQTEYSDNAQFWIGECYYREKRYEEAILEFEEVIKKFPQGNKLPDALLKQAFSFIALNDANSAKLLLQKILDRYPTSAQAEIAKNKLKSL